MTSAPNTTRPPGSGSATGDGGWLPNVLDAVVGCAVIQLDPEGRILAWNAGAAAMFEYSAQEVIGEHVRRLHLVGMATDATIERQLRVAAEAGCVRETGWRVTKNGRRLWIDSSLNAVRSPEGRLLGFAKLAHEATAQYEYLERQRALVESTAYAVIATTTEGIINVFNPAAERLLGYAPEELLHRCTPALLHVPEEVAQRSKELSIELGRPIEPSFETFVAWTRERGLPDERQWTYVRKDGSHIPVLLSVAAFRGPNGEITGYMGIARDIVELADVRRKLAQQEERQRIVFDATQDGTFLTDQAGLILDANPMAEQLWGRRRTNLIGTSITRLVPLPVVSQPTTAGPDSSRRRPTRNTELQCRRHDGSTFPAEVNVTVANLNDSPVQIVTIRDITEQKAAQTERDRLLRVIESASDFVGMADPDGNILYQNPAGNRAVGLPDDADLSGFHVSHMHPPWAAARILDHVIPAALRHGTYVHDTILLARDGTEIPVSQALTMHRDAAGQVEFGSTIMRDLRNQHKAEALLAKVASQVHGMLFQYELAPDGTTRFPYVSPGSIELYGLTPDLLIANDQLLRQVLLPEDADALSATMRQSAANLTPWVFEYRIAAAGALRWHRGQAVPERTPEGTVVWHGFVTDVTDGKLADEESRRRKADLEGAIAALDAGFAMYDAEERLVICNDRYAEMFYLSKATREAHLSYETLLRTGLREHAELRERLPPNADVEQWIAMRLALFRDPKGGYTQMHGERWIRADDRKTANGGTVSMRTDITSIKRAEFEAKLQQERLKLATSAAGLGIWELDVFSGELSWDQRMLELHDCAPDEFHGTYESWQARIHPDDVSQVEDKLQKAIVDGEDFRATFRVVRADGSVRHLESRSGCIRSSEGMIVRVIGVTTDITEQTEVQEALQSAADAARAASKAKAEFLATMSHEIRTPMNGVIGMTNLLIGTELDGNQREYVETIRACGEGLLTLINDILDFSKMEAGKLVIEKVPFSLDQVVMESITLFTTQAEAQGVHLAYQLPSEPTRVLSDPTRVKQILLNLVSNALKFTKVGTVGVRVRVERTSPTHALVEMRVADTGIGMSAEHLNRLGEAFLQADASTTRQYGGTGLGLSICRSLVALLNGTLEVNSELGRGTAFTVRLPLEVTEQAAISEKTSRDPAAELRLHRVLVAEDNAVNQRVVGLMLKKLVTQVDFAVDGREALHLFTLHTYDCVLMDGQMPEMDGLEAARQIRALEAREGRVRTPIIALTANALPGDREMFLDAGMDEYLTKPIRAGDLALTLSKVRPRAHLTGRE